MLLAECKITFDTRNLTIDRNETEVKQLEFAGITGRVSLKDLENNWRISYNKLCRVEHGIKFFPTILLINPEGIVIYNSGEKDDKEQLLQLLLKM